MTLFVWLLVCGIWSTVWLFIKLGVSDVPPFASAATRLLIALAVLVPITLLRPRVAIGGVLILASVMLVMKREEAVRRPTETS